MAYKKGIDATSHTEKGSSKLAQHSKDQLAKVSEDGVWFKSHISGEKYYYALKFLWNCNIKSVQIFIWLLMN